MNAAILCLSVVLGAEPTGYPKANLMIEAEALAKQLDAVVILDARDEKSYQNGHIPGAVQVNVAELSKAFNTETDATAWAKRLGQLGVDATTAVVVYGDAWTDSARVWWMLKQWGVKDVRLFNGNFAAWKAAFPDKVSKTPQAPKQREAQATATNRLATKDQVLSAVKDKSAQILDVRSEGEYCGMTGMAKKKGSIPGAMHLEWKEFIDAKTQKIKPAGEIAALLKKANIDVSKPVVTYCQSGGRAAVGAFVLELMGGEQVRNYYRSWSEWGNADDTPVEKPTKK